LRTWGYKRRGPVTEENPDPRENDSSEEEEEK
jgi:hypothetical protein